MDREDNAYTNLQNIPIKTEIDYADIDCSIIKEELEVGPTVLQERHVDTVLFEVTQFEIIDGSTNIQLDNNDTYLEELFTCNTCSYKAKTKSQLEKHTLSHSKIKNKTQQTKKVKRKRVFNNQNNEVTKKVEHSGGYTTTNLYYNSHRVNTTWDALYTKNGKFRSFTCDQCPYRTSVKAEVNRHKRIHTGRDLYECSICHYKTPFKSRYTRHQVVHTNRRVNSVSVEKTFFCDLCNFKVSTKLHMIMHLRTHAPEGGISRIPKRGISRFKCDKCNKRFTFKTGLLRHMRIHTGELPFWCAHCDFKARDRRMIVRHLNNHAGWKPYSCDKCGIRYRGSESVIRHRRIYHNEKI